jgi:ElaB/YqjD/DUF883 family membrane-anchored ribosome-binding protein
VSAHLDLPDSQLEQLADALELLLAAEANGSSQQLQQQQQQQQRRLERFRADYAPLRTWAGRGRMDRAQRAMEVLLKHVLGS